MNNDIFLTALRESLQNTSLNPNSTGATQSTTRKEKDPLAAAVQAMTTAKNSAPVSVSETVTETTNGPKSLWDLSTEIIRGNYGNGKARQDALEKEGYNYHQVQDFVNKRIWGTLQDSDYNRQYTAQPTVERSKPAFPGSKMVEESIGIGEDLIDTTNRTKVPQSTQAGLSLISAFLDALRKSNPTPPSAGTIE